MQSHKEFGQDLLANFFLFVFVWFVSLIKWLVIVSRALPFTRKHYFRIRFCFVLHLIHLCINGYVSTQLNICTLNECRIWSFGSFFPPKSFFTIFSFEHVERDEENIFHFLSLSLSLSLSPSHWGLKANCRYWMWIEWMNDCALMLESATKSA